MKFADIVALVGRFVFVIQVKDTDVIGNTLHELWKMGYHCKEAADAFERVWRRAHRDDEKREVSMAEKEKEEDMARPRVLLEGILMMWQATTGVAVERIVFCFATSTAKCAEESRARLGKEVASPAIFNYGDASPLSALVDPCVRFVSVDKLNFWEFERCNGAPSPHAQALPGHSKRPRSDDDDGGR